MAELQKHWPQDISGNDHVDVTGCVDFKGAIHDRLKLPSSLVIPNLTDVRPKVEAVQAQISIAFCEQFVPVDERMFDFRCRGRGEDTEKKLNAFRS